MATGTVILYDKGVEQILDGTHDIKADDIRVMLVTNAVTPVVGDAAPAVATYTEVSGTAYTAGGIALTVSLTETAGVVTYDFTNDPVWAQDAAGFTDAYWGIIYNNTNAGKEAIGFIEMGGPASAVSGPVSIQWAALGFFSTAKS